MGDVYRFLATPRWIGFAVGMVLLAATMVWLGRWQLDRYHQRAGVNHRIDASEHAAPVQLTSVLLPKAKPPTSLEWTRVTASGRYDPAHEILVHGRTVDGSVGFEVLTPLVLADGSAVLIDRGWLPPSAGGSRGGTRALPDVPVAPSGVVTVNGRVRLPESRASAPTLIGGRLGTRRISPAAAAAELPYPLYGAYVTLDSQVPLADAKFVPIPASRELAWMNAGYVVQWWMFACLTLYGLGWAIRREAHRDDDHPTDRVAARSRDRAAEAEAVL